MARIMRIPDEMDLPPGTVRDCATLLFYLYRKAHRPALRDISEAIRRDEDLKGTASPETIRRMLRGSSVPAHWATVEAVYLTLCDLAQLNPLRTEVEHNGETLSIRRHIENAWHPALDHPDWFWAESPASADAGRSGYGSSDESPWASDGLSMGTSDEPPF